LSVRVRGSSGEDENELAVIVERED
jgi:hypothetical protein